MKLQLQPNRWSCLPTSFAMALDVQLSTVLAIIGHDGSEIISQWSDYREPYNRRSFHLQELIMVANRFKYTVTQFSPKPISYTLDPNHAYEVPMTQSYTDEVERKIMYSRGVVLGQQQNHTPHAMAVEFGVAFDPSGQNTKLEDFEIETYLEIIKSKNVI